MDTSLSMEVHNILTLGFVLGIFLSVGWDKTITTNIHHHSMDTESFHGPKYPVSHLSIPFHKLLATTDLFTVSWPFSECHID